MIIHFPAMNQGFLTGPAPDSGQFFDPGLEEETMEGAFRPEGMPLSSAKAKRLLHDSLQFGEQFKNPGEMIAQSMFQEAKDSEHSWTIRAEFEQRLKMDAAQDAKASNDAEDSAMVDMAQSQFMLLLAASTQAQSMELQDLSQGVSQAWEEFGEKLGLGDDEYKDESVVSTSATMSATNTFDASPEPLPWPWLLGAMAAYLPQGTVLAASDAEVISVWNDLDLEFSPAAATLGLPAGWKTAAGPAWKLAGKRRAPAGEHWNKELIAALPAE